MKKKVSLSNFCIVLTCLLEVVFVAVLFFTVEEPVPFALWAVLVVAINILGIWHMPVSVEAGVKAIKVHKTFSTLVLPYTTIASVERIQPTMGAIRIFASGGFFGYWGIFREAGIGTYHAAYGRASDCFLVTLKDGKKWMLGCYNPDQIVSCINLELHD